MMNERLHFSRSRLGEIVRPTAQDRTSKPNGLWYSIGPAWAEWCVEASFGLDRFVWLHRLTVDTTRFVVLATPEDVRNFADTYRHDRYGLDWKVVAREYQGIEASPYFHELGLFDSSMLWYYGWDVASGCVWEPSAVLGVDAVSIGGPQAVIHPPGSWGVSSIDD